jgi:hypothetical protein
MLEGFSAPVCFVAAVDALLLVPFPWSEAFAGVDAGVTLSGRAEDDGMLSKSYVTH